MKLFVKIVLAVLTVMAITGAALLDYRSLFVVVLVALIGILTYILILIDATLGWHFISPDRGHTIFVMDGKDVRSILPNVGGHRLSFASDYNSLRWIIRDDNEENREKAFFQKCLFGTAWLQKWLWKFKKIRFVGWSWPYTHVLEYLIDRRILVAPGSTGTAGEKQPIRLRVADSKEQGKLVKSLLFIALRPSYMEGIDMGGDNSKINVVFLATYQQVVPVRPVIYLRGDFFPPLDAVLESAFVDFCATHEVAVDEDGNFIESIYDPRKNAGKGAPGTPYDNGYKPSHLTAAYWTKLNKGPGSPIEAHLKKINVSPEYFEKLKNDTKRQELFQHLQQLSGGDPKPLGTAEAKEKIGSGIIPEIGFALTDLELVGFEPHKDSEDLYKALAARETERRKAAGVIEEAKGAGEAFRLRGEGESNRYGALMKALRAHGATAAEAAEVVREQVSMGELRQSNVTTYVRNGSAGVMIPATPAPPPATTGKT